MKRSTLVTLLLVIAAAVLAIGLFIAGSIWRGRASPKQSLSGKVPTEKERYCSWTSGQRQS